MRWHRRAAPVPGTTYNPKASMGDLCTLSEHHQPLGTLGVSSNSTLTVTDRF